MINSIDKFQEAISELISYVKNLEKKILDLEEELSLYKPKEKIKQTNERPNPDDYLERKSRMLFSNAKDH